MTGFALLKGMAFEWSGATFRIDRLQPNGDLLLERADGQLVLSTRAELLADYAKGAINVLRTACMESPLQSAAVYGRSLAELPTDKKTEAQKRWRYVSALKEKGHFVLTATWLQEFITEVAEDIEDPKPPSPTTLYRWYRRYREHQDIRSLVSRKDLRGSRLVKQSDEVLKLLTQAMQEAYKESPLSTVGNIYTRLNAKIEAENRRRFGTDQLIVPSKRTVYRMLGRVEMYEKVLMKEGKASADKRFRIVKQGTNTADILERVEVDHTPLDLFLIDEKTWLPLGRPTLTVFLDHFSRMVLGYYLSFDSPSAAAVMGALRHAILPKAPTPLAIPNLSIDHEWPCYGRPDLVVADNGLEFHGIDLESVCFDLGVRIQYCPKHQPRFKGSIERYLKTVNYFFAHQLPGTSFARLHQRGDYDPTKHALLTLAEFRHLFEKWMLDVYSQTIHRGIGVTPWAKWQEGLKRREPDLPDSLKDLQKRIGLISERSLRRDGISLNGIRYSGSELQPILSSYGEGVRVRVLFDPEDLGSVQVWGPDQETPVTGYAIDQNYAAGLTMRQNEMIRERARELGLDTENKEALEKAKHDLIMGVQQLMDSRKQKNRRKAAAIQGFSSSNPNPALSESMNASKPRPQKAPKAELDKQVKQIEDLPMVRFTSFSLNRGDGK